MKIAITAKGDELSKPVDPRFGRAEWFIIMDTENGTYEAISNQANKEAESGAGVQSAKDIVDHGVKVLITGHIGPKGFHALNAVGVQVVAGAEGTVRDAYEAYKAGELKLVSKPDVESRWL